MKLLQHLDFFVFVFLFLFHIMDFQELSDYGYNEALKIKSRVNILFVDNTAESYFFCVSYLNLVFILYFMCV